MAPTAAYDPRRELRELAGLAGPLIVVHVGTQMLSLVDSAIAGHISSRALAAVGIGNSVYFTLTVFGLGCILGMDAAASQAIGAGEERRARRVLWQGIRLALAMTLPLMAAVLACAHALPALGIDAATAEETRRYLLGRVFNVAPFLVFAAQRAYLQAKGQTLPILAAVAFANIANVLANIVLVFGDRGLGWLGLPPLGLPALGVLGCGLASSIATVASLAVQALAIRALPSPLDVDRRRFDPALTRTILRVGVPVALQIVAEVGVFAIVAVLAGRLSQTAAAAHQTALVLISFTFNVTLGIGAATAMRVGFHVGRDDTSSARRAGHLGLTASTAFMCCSALTFVLARRALAGIVTDDGAVIAAALPLVAIAAVFQVSDGTQAVAAGALRGAGDTRVSLIANLVGHYAVGLPIAAVLAFPLRLGAPGLWWGLTAGLSSVAVVLVLRFRRLTRRRVERV